MNKRILVAYATRAGSTAEVAVEIGNHLRSKGYIVDVKPIKEAPSLDSYHGVFIGSAIRMGSWLPEAVNFLKNNQDALSQVPVAIFTVHMLNTGEDDTSQTNRSLYLKNVQPLVQPAAEAFFAGKMELGRLSFFDRFIANMVKAVDSDNRDWEKIKGWSEQVIEEMKQLDE